MALANPAGKVPLGARHFNWSFPIKGSNSAANQIIAPLFYFDRAAVITRAYAFSVATAGTGSADVGFSLAYVSLAKGVVLANPNNISSYTSLVSGTVADGVDEFPGTIRELIGETDDAVEVPANALLVYHMPVEGSNYPLELLEGLLVQVSGYYKGFQG
jgi:hypothetical protein